MTNNINNSVINVVYCTDTNYIEHVAVSITSILLNNLQNNIQFHIFLYDVPLEQQIKLTKINASIFIYPFPKEEFNRYEENQNNKIKHINKSMYMRLAVPRLINNKIDKFIYLDSDILCFADISPILNINIESVVCAVAVDSPCKKHIIKNTNRLNLLSQNYFNSGFLYINTKNWITFNTEEKVNKILSSTNKGQLIYPDQDALNMVLEQHILLIDKKWNYLFTWMDNVEKESFFYHKKTLPYFIHFTGSRKMWYQEHTGLAQNIYCFYKHFTPWANTPLKSYKAKMRVNDYRIYAKTFFKKKQIIKGMKYYFHYLKLKILNR
ncbi:glycosyltransferase [Orbaceae bacterium ESL0727]|nr:glycosyltransferase [Orbaceae bacterium ESL0727]